MPTPSTSRSDLNPRPFSRHVIIASGIIAAMIMLFVFLWYAAYVLLLAFSGVLVAILLSGAAGWMRKVTGLSSRLSLILTILLLLAASVGIGWFAAPQIFTQMEQLAEKVPASLESVIENVQQYYWGRWLVETLPDERQLGAAAGPEMVSRASGVVSITVGAILSLIVVIFVGLYVALNPTLYTSGLLRLVPLEQRPRGRRFWPRSATCCGGG